MTNEELFTDLKQFIEATVSQQTAELRGDIIGAVRDEMRAVNTRIDTLDEKLDLIQEAIGESFAQASGETKTTLQNHETRIHRLERKAA